MRVLFTACPLFGHVNTVMPLALAARRAGHDVVLATGAGHAERVRAAGIPAWPVGPDDAGPPTSPQWFAVTGQQRAEDLLPRATRWRPDVVVHEETELAGALAASTCGARLVVHELGIAASGSADTRAAIVGDIGERWGLPDLARLMASAETLSICPPALRPAGVTPRANERPLRPTLPPPTEDEQLPAELPATGRPLVHLTLGTIYHARDVLAAAAEGLRGLPVDLVVSTGGTDIGPQPSPVVVAPYVPHALLLPRCTLVVSQGGAGILLAAFAHGLAQLVLPQGADQFANADAAVATGAALALRPGEVTAAAVAAAARELLDEPGHAAAARTVQAQIAAMPGPDEVWASLTA